MAEECAGSGGGGAGASPGAAEEECPPVIVSWEGSADIQSGDILIVRIADSLLLETFGQVDVKNGTPEANISHADGERSVIFRVVKLRVTYLYTTVGSEPYHLSVS